MPKRFIMDQMEKWDRLADTWLEAASPASPSTADIEHFADLTLEALGGARSGKIMLLGCTPGLRELLSKGAFSHFDVVCVDSSPKMYKVTTRAMKVPNPRERLCVGDWRGVDAGKGKYNAVLGDHVIDNITQDDWPSFFATVHEHLRPGGGLIVRLAVRDRCFKGVTFLDALKRWGTCHAGGCESVRRAAAGLWDEILSASAFRGASLPRTLTIDIFADEIEATFHRQESFDKPTRDVFQEFIRMFWSVRGAMWSSYDLAEVIEAAKPYFFHVKTVHSSDYKLSRVHPIVLIRALETHNTQTFGGS